MGLRFKWILLSLLFVALFGYVTSEALTEVSQAVRAAPHKDIGINIKDVVNKASFFSSEDVNYGLGERNNGNSRVSVSTVALFTLAMAAATGLGAVPFFFVELDHQWAGICNRMAAGVMLAASFDLIQEGQEHGSGNWVVFGILSGAIFIWLCKKVLEQYGQVSMLDIKGADATKVVLVIGIMTLHSFGEGSGVGVSFAGSKGFSQGLLVTLAIAVHNIPKGLAVSMVLASRGVSPQNAMLWSVITSLPQPLVAVPAFICADAFNKFLPFCTGFAAGCMIWMVIVEVLPDAFKEASPSQVASSATLAVAFMKEAPIKSTPTKSPPLHTLQLLRRTKLNRAFAAVYTCAVLALFYRHALNILHSTTAISTFLHSSLLIADLILAFMWSTTQSFRVRPLRRQVFVENLENALKGKDYPAMDVFICTADPFKEPPIGVVNTALSVMAYDYPTEKISVYVSDDGGSKLTLFAFFEAAKFAKHWLPFCRNNSIMERSPEVYLNGCGSSEAAKDIRMMYEMMKARIENVVERREVGEEYINGQEEYEAFQKWSNHVDFTSQDHPTVIQVLLESDQDRDISGHLMPNLVYVSRQKSNASPHHFKAGALNVLLRVSATMTNAPIILTQDCDMYSNDPKTPQRALCYFFDLDIRTTLGFVQFPQRFHGINENDIYACEHKHLYQIKPAGMDGLAGPSYVGSGCFFSRRVFFGSPTSFISPEIEELRPHHIIYRSKSKSIETLTHEVASCNYESGTKWGSKMGFRYGSLSEDYNTGYQMHCQGWRSIFCHPERAAFLGDIPISLFDVLTQNKRWAVGLLQISLNKYSPITFGVRSMGILMGLASSHDPFWPFLSIPMVVYAFLPQLALFNRVSILPKASDLCFLLYAFLFIGAYTQDLIDFILGGGTFQQWWNNQRMWMIRGLTSYLFGFIEYILKELGLSIQGFNVTSKVITDQEQSKRYKQGKFEFGVESPMFVTLTSAALVNIFSFSNSLVDLIVLRNLDEGLVLQTIFAGFVVLNCWPIYDAVLFRSDKGRMPIRVSLVSVFFVWVACKTFSFLSLQAGDAI